MIETAFTPVNAVIGGVLIGLAATRLYATCGRIAGISGLLNRVIEERNERGWRLLFLLGLLAGAGLWFTLGNPPLTARTDFSLPWLLLAGLLVGIGTRLGNGCTSGHGICGLARLSKRSLVAVLVFMACGIATTTLLRHALGAAG